MKITGLALTSLLFTASAQNPFTIGCKHWLDANEKLMNSRPTGRFKDFLNENRNTFLGHENKPIAILRDEHFADVIQFSDCYFESKLNSLKNGNLIDIEPDLANTDAYKKFINEASKIQTINHHYVVSSNPKGKLLFISLERASSNNIELFEEIQKGKALSAESTMKLGFKTGKNQVPEFDRALFSIISGIKNSSIKPLLIPSNILKVAIESDEMLKPSEKKFLRSKIQGSGDSIEINERSSDPFMNSLIDTVISINNSPARSIDNKSNLPYYKMSWDNQPLKDYVQSYKIEKNVANKEDKANISFADKVLKEETPAKNFEL